MIYSDLHASPDQCFICFLVNHVPLSGNERSLRGHAIRLSSGQKQGQMGVSPVHKQKHPPPQRKKK